MCFSASEHDIFPENTTDIRCRNLKSDSRSLQNFKITSFDLIGSGKLSANDIEKLKIPIYF